MKPSRLLLVAALALAAAFPLLAQPRPGAAELPIKRIVLFNSGVGYFQRDGQVDGNAHVDLQFPAASVNDLLKSLVLQDQGGGRISTVTYDNRDPVEKTLKSFAIDLTSNPSLGQLLQQVRGEQVEITLAPEKGVTAAVTGSVVGVEKQKKPAGQNQTVEVEMLNLLTVDGLRSVALDQVQRVKLVKPELQEEFRKALAVLAAAHDKRKKTVTLNFLGNGQRAVRVGYVTESPVWKTSYRLSLDGDKAFLQGWAIVENTTDDDWKQVSLGLISGRPISFQMDLYDPLYVTRPVVEPELFASLRPPSYSGSLGDDRKPAMVPPAPAATGMMRGMGMGGPGGMGGGMGAAGAAGRAGAEQLGRRANQPARAGKDMEVLLKQSDDKAEALNFRDGVASAAVATELGEYFQYQIEQPVTLPRQKSALLPIVNQDVEAKKLSIYNEGVHAKYPLHGLRFKNTSGLHLMQGPVTLFENGYAGDGRIPDMQPNETRLVSYAVDLGTEVAPETKAFNEDLVTVKIVKGILEATYKSRRTKMYTVKNRGEREKLVLVEHPIDPSWKLVTPEKPAERSRDVYRFEVHAVSGKPVKLDVVEEMTRLNQVELTNSDDETVRFFVRSSGSNPKVKQALEEALALKGKLNDTQREIATEQKALQVIEQDQDRMRKNMERVPQTSEAYKRYLKKFDEQETEIEKRRERVVKLQETAEQQGKAYEQFLANLNVE